MGICNSKDVVVEDNEVEVEIVNDKKSKNKNNNIGDKNRTSSQDNYIVTDITHESLEESEFKTKYKLLRVLGKGNFAAVWLAEEVSNANNLFAVKVFNKNVKDSELFHIRREIRLMELVSGHPNVCTVHHVFEDSKHIYLLMDYCNGGNLLDLCLKKGSRTEQETALIVRDIANVLAYIHDLGIVHRDVKLENIMLCYDEKLRKSTFKLGDFGLAKSIKVIDKETNTEHMRLLKSACGSPLYVAPEIVRRRPYSFSVDVWSLGVVTYSLLSGMNPFYRDGANNKQLYRRIRIGQYSFRQSRWDHISRSTKKFICVVLNTDPRTRIKSHQICKSEWVINLTKSQLSPILASTREASPVSSISKKMHNSNETKENKNISSDDIVPISNFGTSRSSDDTPSSGNRDKMIATPSSVLRKIDGNAEPSSGGLQASHSQNEIIDIHSNNLSGKSMTTPSANVRRQSDLTFVYQ